MKTWDRTPIEKIYEAFSAVADGRVVMNGDTAKVFSSSRDKAYDVLFDPEGNAIMVNDNASFFVGYLGYPAVAFLMVHGDISYNKDAVDLLRDIPWKEINTKHKNDFAKAVFEVLSQIPHKERTLVEKEATCIHEYLSHKTFFLLGKKMRPPAGNKP